MAWLGMAWHGMAFVAGLWEHSLSLSPVSICAHVTVSKFTPIYVYICSSFAHVARRWTHVLCLLTTKLGQIDNMPPQSEHRLATTNNTI